MAYIYTQYMDAKISTFKNSEFALCEPEAIYLLRASVVLSVIVLKLHMGSPNPFWSQMCRMRK